MTRTQPGQADRPAALAALVAVASPERVTTRPGGPAAIIRPAYAADQAALGDFFAALSPHSRYLRFFGPVTPGPALLRRLCGDAEGVDAVVAVRGGLIIGHAMAADQAGPPGPPGPPGPHDSRVTDIGVVVADAWQGRGVGAALMRAIVTGAQARGLTSMTMDVLHGNQRVLAMIMAHWPAAGIGHSGDGLAIRIPLEDQHQHQHQHRHQQPSAATA
jgi:ribosomal protein S18 acetylase RimI-like enzyme